MRKIKAYSIVSKKNDEEEINHFYVEKINNKLKTEFLRKCKNPFLYENIHKTHEAYLDKNPRMSKIETKISEYIK